MKITDIEIAAAERVVPVAELFAQIVTERLPGQYRFAENFPDECTTWIKVAAMFRQSPVKEVRTIGRTMADFAESIEAADKAQTKRQIKRALVAVNRKAKKVLSAWDAFCERMIAEAVADDGVRD
ncbi:hypothetical protein GNP92_15020 [Paenibacillus timonensis]|nr:hypothetical protein [Paenibacillus timonensis]MUG87653.1 hypothetical protein [Paenibacillus timonensis]